ncbi:MAG TPA: metallophosphoesterase [Myxococcales bacterium]|nr:metallophosphoesterase [Myxococcales bacterium]
MRSPFLAAAVGACTAVVSLSCIPQRGSGECAPGGGVVDPCADAGNASGGLPGTPDPGIVPGGTVGFDGGTVERLWFATTGDTRPGFCDRTSEYPTTTITQIARAMRGMKVQFAVDLGDHMYVCNGSATVAREQMALYMGAAAQGPATWWMTMGNHECGNDAPPFSCFVGDGDANFAAYMAALRRALPYYFTDVRTALGKARFVVVADDSWNAAQADWLESTLAAADTEAAYTVIARHHPMTGSESGNPRIVATIARHKYSLILTAHSHLYAHDTVDFGGRSVVLGVGGVPTGSLPGFATVLQNPDRSLTFVRRDANGNPLDVPWTVPPQ